MRRRWTETIDAHRRGVQEAIVETTAALVRTDGLAAVTMAQIAQETGIGRATLYKHYPDVEAILVAWHERDVTQRLRVLCEARDRHADPGERLDAVLETYAVMQHEHRGAQNPDGPHGPRGHHASGTHAHARHHVGMGHVPGRPSGEVGALVHRSEHVARVESRLTGLMRDVLKDAAKAGTVRKDVPPEELARFCLDALAAARGLPSSAAVRRLVAVTRSGLRPRR